VQLEQKSPASGGKIELGKDTTSFFAATKLDVGSFEPGTDGDLESPIADVAELGGITSGSFSVNGVQLSVDVAADSLSDVLQRINASGAGVLASYDEDSGQVQLESLSGGVMILEDGTKYVSSVRIGTVARIRPGQAPELIASGIPSAASMCYDPTRERLIVPMNSWFSLAFVELR